MVIVRLIGGLGNQMFQYAAGFRLSRVHGVPLKLDISGFQDTPSRDFSLQNFDISGTVASRNELAWLVKWPSRNRLVWQMTRRLGFSPCTMVHERHFHFDDEVLHLSGNVYLSGYWQSEKYFADIAEEVRAQFTLKSPLGDRDLALLAEITSTNSVSLHVRRGDYVSDPVVSKAHGLCSIEYYTAAAELIASKLKSPFFFIFSDDPEWSQQKLRLRWPTTFMPSKGPANAHTDLRLMSSCKHHIIANSSFSWWGAWLNQTPDTIVIAPSRWFNEFKADTRDLLPESWVKL
jgi:hypothetical protein